MLSQILAWYVFDTLGIQVGGQRRWVYSPGYGSHPVDVPVVWVETTTNPCGEIPDTWVVYWQGEGMGWEHVSKLTLWPDRIEVWLSHPDAAPEHGKSTTIVGDMADPTIADRLLTEYRHLFDIHWFLPDAVWRKTNVG